MTSSRPGTAAATRQPGNVEPSARGRGPDAVQSAHPTSLVQPPQPGREKDRSSVSVRLRQTSAVSAAMTVACSSRYGKEAICIKASVRFVRKCDSLWASPQS